MVIAASSATAQIEMIDELTTKTTIQRFKDRKDLQLVMSDEFEVENRRFEKGFDKFFESITKPDETNNAMQFCKEFILHSLSLSFSLPVDFVPRFL